MQQAAAERHEAASLLEMHGELLSSGRDRRHREWSPEHVLDAAVVGGFMQ